MIYKEEDWTETYRELWEILCEVIGGNPERICAFGIVDGDCFIHNKDNASAVLADIEIPD